MNGEIVYVKEAYRSIDFDLRDLNAPMQRVKVEYKLDGKTAWVFKPKDKKITIPDKWHSPMMMPEWAARTFLTILDNRPERLYEITEEDAIKEGCIADFEYQIKHDQEEYQGGYAREHYFTLWDSINPKYPSSINPWVFKYTFKVVER